jgi:hypothetical protein
MDIPSSATIILPFAGLRFVFMFDVPFTPCRNIGKAHYIFRPERPNPVDREERLPRLTRLLGEMRRTRAQRGIPDYAELARRGWVTRARITQIVNLLHLASPIQEEILHWPDGTSQGSRSVRRVAAADANPVVVETTGAVASTPPRSYRDSR